MSDYSKAYAIIALFAQYGFRKTSMGELAQSADLSRQSLYNQFGSKDAVLDWAVGTYTSHLTQNAIESLQNSHDTMITQAITNAYDIWIGQHIGIWRGTPHGAELLEFAIEAAKGSDIDYEARFKTAIHHLLIARRYGPDRADDAIYVLHLAAKGLLMKCDNRDDFLKGIQKVTHTLLATTS